jgi:hypothetical protein
VKKSRRNIVLLILLLPFMVAFTGITVIKHDCSFCSHSDVDFFMIDECCETGNHSSCCAEENHEHSGTCCHSETELNEELHKCRHTVYEFSYSTTFSVAKTLVADIASFVAVTITKTDYLLTPSRLFFNYFRPPPLYLSNCNLRV